MSHVHTRFTNQSLLAPDDKVSDGQLAEEVKMLAAARATQRVNRRGFIAGLSAAGAAAGAFALTGCSDDGPIMTTAVTPGVFDVLNFALNLEYLEANFYNFLANGTGVPSANQGSNPGTVSGGAAFTFTNPIVKNAAAQLANDEVEHVAFLRSTISSAGGTPVSMPNINLAAMGAVTSDASFLAMARQLEATGVSAYIGGSQYLVSNTTALFYAAQILDTEAQHAGFLRELCIALGVTSPALDSLDTPPTSTAVFNTSPTTGLNPVRTTSQVLQIVYGAAGKTGVASGGFFPNGLNGTIYIS